MSLKKLTLSLEKILASESEFKVIAENFEEWFDEVSYDDSLDNDERFELISDLLSNPKTPSGVLDILAKRFSDWQYWTETRIEFLEALIRHPNISGNTLESLITSSDYSLGWYVLGVVKEALVSAKNLTARSLSRLLKYEIEGSILLYQSIPNFLDFGRSPEEAEFITITLGAASSEHINPSELQAMAFNQPLLKCTEICLNSMNDSNEGTEATITSCEGHAIIHVDYLLARNPNTPTTALKKLSKHKNFHVRIVVALNPATTPEILEQMFLGEESFRFLNSEMGDGHLFCWYLHDQEYFSGHPAVYAALAMNLNTPIDSRIKCLEVPWMKWVSNIDSFIKEVYLNYDFESYANISDIDISEIIAFLQSSEEYVFEIDESTYRDPLVEEIVSRKRCRK